MAHDANFPANDSFLADFPPKMREEIRAIINDAIVNALSVQGLKPGNDPGNIPVSNNKLCAGLNAEKLGGNLASAFAPANYMPPVASSSGNGVMSNTDKAKLDSISAGAEVNQNTFSNVLINGNTIQADGKMDTLEIVAGANVALTVDAANDRFIIAVTGTVPSATTAGTCTGNAASATQLATARTIKFSGGVTGEANFDGTKDLPIVMTITGNAPTATSATVAGACTGNAATATKLQNARTIALTGSVSGKMSFDGKEDIKIETSPAISIMGMENYIVDGLEVTPRYNAGLNIWVSAGHANIAGKSLTLASDTSFALNPNKASLVYLDQNGVLGKTEAGYPDADTDTVLRYVFNEVSGQVVDSSGNGNHGTVNGAMARHVSGWADHALRSDGSGYVVSVSSKNFPLGNDARQIDILLTLTSDTPGYEETLVSYGTAGNEFSIVRNTNRNLAVYLQGTVHDTGYTLYSGETYIISYCYDRGGNDDYDMYVFVNGLRIYGFNQENAITTVNTALYILGNRNGQGIAKAIIHYLELRKGVRDNGVSEGISNRLCLPCHEYEDINEETRTFSRDMLPFDDDGNRFLAIPLVFVKTDASEVVRVRSQHKYGIRKGLFDGKYMQCLGWKDFEGPTVLTWENPYIIGSRIRTIFLWEDVVEVQNEFYNNGVGYGVALRPTKSDRIRCQTLPGGVCVYNGVWQTSGVIFCYAEVLE